MKLKTDIQGVWFTSDWHLGHKNVIKHSNRPFDGVAQMENILIRNFNKCVSPRDIVFYLGDFCWHKAIPERVLPELNGVWHWITGNHDKEIMSYLNKNGIPHHQILDIVVDEQPITLCHYPMATWNKSHYGAWQLYGHHHSQTNIPTPDWTDDKFYAFNGKKLNVNIEIWGYEPVPFWKIKGHMDQNRPENWDLIKRN